MSDLKTRIAEYEKTNPDASAMDKINFAAAYTLGKVDGIQMRTDTTISCEKLLGGKAPGWTRKGRPNAG